MQKAKGNKQVAIIAGWAEGPWQTKRFRNELKKAGLQLINDPRKADVIIGHSLGCYLIPKGIEGKTIVLIGLPYWPGRSIPASIRMKLKAEVGSHRKDESLGWWLNKLFHNGWYILTRPSKTYSAFSRQKPENLPDGKTNRVTLFRPSGDTFCHPDVMKMLPKAKNYKFIEISGAHDDCWLKPESYVDLLLKEI